MSHHFIARSGVALTLLVVIALSPSAALAGKEHCRKLTFDGVAGALSQDVVGFQVVRPDASVINQSDPTVQVLANESALDFMARIVEDWCTEDGTVCPTFTTPPTSFCANSLGASSCKLKLKISPKIGTLPPENVGTKKKYIEICCFDEPDCKKKLGTADPTDVPITVQAQVNAGPECPLDSSLPLIGEAQCTVNLDPIGVIQLAAPGADGCRSDMAAAARSYLSTAIKSYGDCHRMRDVVGDPTDCLTISEVDTKGKIAAMAAKLQSVAAACASEGSPANAGYAECPAPCSAFSTSTCTAGNTGAPCTSDRACDTSPGSLDGRCGDWSAVGGCLTCLLDNAVEAAAGEVLGEPFPVPLDGATTQCHLEMAQGFERFALTRIGEAFGCQKKVDGGKLARPTAPDNCTTLDLKGLIDQAEGQATGGVTGACDDLTVDDLDVCSGAATVGDYNTCLLAESSALSSAAAAALFPELRPRDPGTCPTRATLLLAGGAVGPAGVCVDNGDCIPGDCLNGVCVNPTEFDYGWSGVTHDQDVADKSALNVSVLCGASGAPCGPCTISLPAEDDDNCRCQNDSAIRCDEPFGPDVDDCGGATCECYLGPPQPIGVGGSPACLMHRLTSPSTGFLDVDTSDAALPVNEHMRVHLGISATQPCPTCVAGTCNGGERTGLPCAAPAIHGTFGPVSLDCPPSLASNISGPGLRVSLPLTTGPTSLTAALPCDPPLGFLDCHCAVCSLDPSVACSSDTDCALASAGLCNATAGAPRVTNACNDLVCSDVGGGTQGQCNAGPVESYCDGFTYADGDGLLPCTNNSDCAAYGPGTGNCTITENRRCFLDTISDAGFAGVSTNRLVGTTCMPPTGSGAANNALGLPGPAHVAMVTRPILHCSDGVSQYVPAVGGCP